MISEKIIKAKGDSFAKQIKGIFKKYGLDVEELDKKYKSFKSPDFFVTTKDKKQSFICECKYIFSAGAIDNGKYNVSTEDKGLATRNKGAFRFDSFTKVEEVIRGAENQYREFVKNKKEYKNYPFVVVLDFDFFADSFDYIPRDIYKLENVSAIMRIERDHELRKALQSLTIDQLEKLIKKEITINLPANSKNFRVLQNKESPNKFQASKILKTPIIA